MYPEITFFGVKISSYVLFLCLGGLVAGFGGFVMARKRLGAKFKKQILVLIGCMGLLGLIGARFFNVLINFAWYAEDFKRVYAISSQGFSLYGGMIGVLTSAIILARYFKIPVLKFADSLVPFSFLGLVFIRVGCFLNGCCYGKETSLSWGVVFPQFSQAHIHQITEHPFFSGSAVHAVHPTQLYEMIFALLLFIAALFVSKKNKLPAGVLFFSVIGLFSIFRWFNMTLRVLPYSELVLNILYPLLYLVIAIYSFYQTYKLMKKS